MPEAKDNFGIKGKVSWVLRDKDGNIKEQGSYENTVTELHDALVADRLAGGSDQLINWGHAGTGSGGTSASTILAAEFAESRTTLTSSTQQAGGDDNDVQYIYTLAAGVCTGAIEEIGIFTSEAYNSGGLCCYNDTISLTKGASDTLTITWTVTYGAS